MSSSSSPDPQKEFQLEPEAAAVLSEAAATSAASQAVMAAAAAKFGLEATKANTTSSSSSSTTSSRQRGKKNLRMVSNERHVNSALFGRIHTAANWVLYFIQRWWQKGFMNVVYACHTEKNVLSAKVPGFIFFCVLLY